MTHLQKIFALARKVFSDEINGINQVMQNLNADFAKSVSLLLECRGKVVITGIGKSGHIAKKIAATFASTGTPSFFVHVSPASLNPSLRGSLLLRQDRKSVV